MLWVGLAVFAVAASAADLAGRAVGAAGPEDQVWGGDPGRNVDIPAGLAINAVHTCEQSRQRVAG